MIKICFVCTGNTCRSIMAERLLKKMIKDKKIDNIKVSSRGILAKGENIAQNAKFVLKECRASAANRKAVKLGKIDKDTLYIAMTENQKAQVKSDKVITMKSLLGEDIADPFGQSIEEYRKVAQKLILANQVLLDKIFEHK